MKPGYLAAMAAKDARIAELETERDAMRAALNEVHSWIVCAAIASPEDMMQSAARIEEITRPRAQCSYPQCDCDGPAPDGSCAQIRRNGSNEGVRQ